MLFKKFLFLTLSFISFDLFSYPIGLWEGKKDNKIVKVIFERHSYDNNDLDFVANKYTKTLFEYLFRNKSNTNFILELRPETIDYIKRNIGKIDDRDTLTLLEYVAVFYNFSFGNNIFQHADIRPSNLIHDIAEDIVVGRYVFDENVLNYNLKTYLYNINSLKNKILEQIYCLENVNLEMLQALDKRIDENINKLVNFEFWKLFKSNESLNIVIAFLALTKEYFLKYKKFNSKFYDEINKFFDLIKKKYTKDEINNILLELEKLEDKEEDLLPLWYIDCDIYCLIADLGFIYKILTALNNFGEIVVCCGAKHANNIVKYLKSINFTSIKEIRDERPNEFSILPKDFENFLFGKNEQSIMNKYIKKKILNYEFMLLKIISKIKSKFC